MERKSGEMVIKGGLNSTLIDKVLFFVCFWFGGGLLSGSGMNNTSGVGSRGSTFIGLLKATLGRKIKESGVHRLAERRKCRCISNKRWSQANQARINKAREATKAPLVNKVLTLFQLNHGFFIWCNINGLLIIINDKPWFRTTWLFHMAH